MILYLGIVYKNIIQVYMNMYVHMYMSWKRQLKTDSMNEMSFSIG